MTFKLQLLEEGKPLAGKTLKWLRTGDDQKAAKGEGISSETQPLVIITSLDKPGFVHLEISVFDSDGSPLKDAQKKPLKFEGGAGVEPAKLEGYPEPEDFDAYWRVQKTLLAGVPMQATLCLVTSTNPKFEVFDVKVTCAGGMPVAGYLTIPKDAKAKSLPAQVSFIGYDVCGVNPQYRPGVLAFCINAHGIDNGREPAYYKALADGPLKHYTFNNVENARPETSYFNGMMLRLMRALEFVKSRPEWDGKTLAVSGTSQGGLQAVAAAALDSAVTECSVGKPWCCDLGGVKFGRLSGWRPDFVPALGYFDTANLARRVKCKTAIVAGLGDYGCPPSGVSILYNHLKGPKSIEYLQGTTHQYDAPNPVKQILRCP